jgi:hypothetical protein
MTARTPILRRRQPARSHTDWTLTRSLRRSCSAEVLAAGQLPDPATDQQRAALGRRLTDTQHKIASLVSAIESGIEPTLLGQQLATRIAEKDRILREIGRLEPPGAVSAREIRGLIEMVGSVADALESANHEEHHRIYAACRLTCEYDPETRSVRASIVDPTDGAWEFERVRGGT